MKPSGSPLSREKLLQAIKALEGLRGSMDEELMELTLAVLNKQLTLLDSDAPIEQQRKQVTILFMDIVSSTQLIRDLDPEENLAIVDGALHRLAGPIEFFGGQVTRFMGDGFLAVFGLPKARENDPQMGVRAGLKILAEANEIAADLRESHKIESFRVRVGINTGLIVSGGLTEAEVTMMGAAVNLAARLESAAPVGGLLISEYTRAHIRGLFELRPGGAIEMKGFAEPVQVYLVEGETPRARRKKARGVEGIQTELIGRDEEINLLQSGFNRAQKEGNAEHLLVLGEAGMGKTRLLESFESWLLSQTVPVTLFKTRATLDAQDTPYSLLRELLLSRFNILEGDNPSTVKAKISACFQDVLEDTARGERSAAFVGHLIGYDFSNSPHLRDVLDHPQQLRNRATLYLSNFLRAESKRALLVLFLEDLHWADDSSLAVLAQLLIDLDSAPLFIISLARPSLVEHYPNWGRSTQQPPIILSPLTEKESHQLLSHILAKVDQIPDRLFERISQNAGGNPYYIEELVNMLFDERVIEQEGDVWRAHQDRLHALNIPPTLHGVLQARLDRLPFAEKNLVQAGAVIGKAFWDSALVELTETFALSSADEIRSLLGDLCDKGILTRQQPSSITESNEFQFKHAILQEVAYASVLKRKRTHGHAQTAAWLIRHSDDGVDDRAGLIAAHYEKAGQVGPALEHYSRAAEKAVANYAVNEALDFYERALALTAEEDIERRVQLLLGQERVLNLRGDRDKQRANQQQLAVLTDALGDEALSVELLIRRAWLAYWTSDLPEAARLAEEGAVRATAIGKTDQALNATYALAWSKLLSGDTSLAQATAEEGLKLAESSGNLSAKGNMLNILGMIRGNKGEFDASLEHLREFVQISQSMGNLDRELTGRNNLGVELTRLGDFAAAKIHFERILTLARENGDRSSVSTALINLAWVAVSQGEWQEALRWAREGIEKKRAYEHSEAAAEGLIWLGHAHAGLGEWEEALDAYHTSLQIRDTLDQPYLAMGLRAGIARVFLAQDKLPEAFQEADKIAKFLDAGGSLEATWEPLRIYLTCFQVLDRAKDPRSDAILAQGAAILKERAEKIKDPSLKACYMENIPWHGELNRLWKMREQR